MQTKSNHTPSNLAGILLTLIILLATYYIAHRYIVPLAWAGMIVIASWPLYQRWLTLWRGHNNWAALTLTMIIMILILAPLTWILIILSKEAQLASHFIMLHNKTGIIAPTWLIHIPVIGNKVLAYWQSNLSQPQFLHHLATMLNQHYQTFGSYVRLISAKTLYHSVGFLFSMLASFFFYRDGQAMATTINAVGNNVLSQRWNHYFSNLAQAVRSVVNGTVFTGFGVGIIMSISYAFTSLPFPALFGLATAILAMIPFGMVLIMIFVIATLLIQGSYIAAVVILVIGTVISLVADHIIKPNLIGNAIKLPFLMILIGIIGGIEAMGVIGLFLGPIIMVLLYKLFDEYAHRPTAP